MSNVSFYLWLLMRRAAVMVILFLGCSLAGLVLALNLPTTYISTGRMLLQAQEISEDLAASTVRIAAREELTLLREQIMTRATLIDIAQDYEVFEGMLQMSPDDIVGAMRDATSMISSGGPSRQTGPQPALLEISFQARRGEIARDVVNEYITRLQTANVEIRTGAANQTLNFFQREVERLGDELARRSAQISTFQNENADALPVDQPFRLQRQVTLQQFIASAEREMRAIEEQRARTILIFEQTGSIGSGANRSPQEIELDTLQAELRRALVNLSDTNPRVVQLRRQISQLEEEIVNQVAPLTEQADPDVDPDNPVAPLLTLQLTDIDARMESLNNQIADAEEELRRLEDAIARSPTNGIDLDRLQRAYDRVQIEYDNAERDLAQASIGASIEAQGRGQRLTLLDPPVVPSSPSGTSRIVVAAGGAGLGLLLAAAFFILLEILNRAVRRPAELEKKLGIMPLASLPYIETAGQRFRRIGMRLAVFVAVVGTVPMLLWAINLYVVPLEDLAQQALTRIGLI